MPGEKRTFWIGSGLARKAGPGPLLPPKTQPETNVSKAMTTTAWGFLDANDWHLDPPIKTLNKWMPTNAPKNAIDSTALGKLIACQQPQWACWETHHPKV